VTHSVEEAVFLGNHIMVLTDKPAQVKEIIYNPDFGAIDFRVKSEYFNMAKHVRNVLEI
jgi:NitT/TauT family transport system ATP-binding protein